MTTEQIKTATASGERAGRAVKQRDNSRSTEEIRWFGEYRRSQPEADRRELQAIFDEAYRSEARGRQTCT